MVPYNGPVVILAVLTMMASLAQYVAIIKNISKGSDPLDLLDKIFIKDFNKMTVLSVLGVTIPVLFGLIYGIMIGFNLFFSFFKFSKNEEVKQLFKSSVLPLALVALVILFRNVMSHLGGLYASLTVTSAIIIGCVIYYRKMSSTKPPLFEKGVDPNKL